MSDFGSGHDLTVSEFKPCVRLCTDSSEPGACFGFCVLSLPLPLLVLCLSLSLSKINIKKKLKRIHRSISGTQRQTFQIKVSSMLFYLHHDKEGCEEDSTLEKPNNTIHHINRLEKKNPMIISIYGKIKKSCNAIQH